MTTTDTSIAEKSYRFADGVIYTIEKSGASIYRIGDSRSLMDVEDEHVHALDLLTAGKIPREFHEHIPELLKAGVLVEGEPKVDDIIRTKLRSLDKTYMASWEDNLSPKAMKAYELLLDVNARRKRHFTSLGQCPILPEGALRRALLVGDADDVGVKDILLIGDDDMVSVALATLGHRVTVYDLDDILLETLRDIAKTHDLDLSAEEVDLRDPLDEEDARFDIFLTDPMSNSDCFELFLSRAFALLKPDGIGYSAVYGAAQDVFRRVASEMDFEIVKWHRRHNRYYSHFMTLHWYESDWVEIRPGAALDLRPPADEYATPINLYREDYFSHKPPYLGSISNIKDKRFATPMYLDILFDYVEDIDVAVVLDREMSLGKDWTAVHALQPDGYISLYVDREKEQINYNLFPHSPVLEKRLRTFLMNAYKREGTGERIAITRDGWDIRVL